MLSVGGIGTWKVQHQKLQWQQPMCSPLELLLPVRYWYINTHILSICYNDVNGSPLVFEIRQPSWRLPSHFVWIICCLALWYILMICERLFCLLSLLLCLGIIGGTTLALVCIVLVIMFLVYRMRKKDEGSYALDEPKNSSSTGLKKSNDCEFFA